MHSLLTRSSSVIVLLLGLAALWGMLALFPVQDDPPYDYLAIGNSITRHPECEYWWDDIGMAASEESRDYFHIVTAYLQTRHDTVNAQAVNLVEWEVAAGKAREKTYRLIDPYLTEELDLITVQLSENAASSRMLSRDCERLIRHIQEKCPQARVLLIDDFWSDAKHRAKLRAAESLGIPFADLSLIRGSPACQWSLGDTVYGGDGQPHVIENPDVARHPNDLGMAYIAGQVIRLIQSLP